MHYPCRFSELPHSRCWSCGALHRSKEALDTMPLFECSGCHVAVFCSAKCATAARRHGQKAKCPGWARLDELDVDKRINICMPHQDITSTHCTDVVAPWAEALEGDPSDDWGWVAPVAAAVEHAGLTLADVVSVADVSTNSVARLPEMEYRWYADAVSGGALEAPLREHGGRVLRVVVTTNPQTVWSFGPADLGLEGV